MIDKIQLYIQDIVQETSDTITIHFAQPEQQLNYLSGQFITLISEIEGKEERRSYSLCSSPYIDKNLSVTVKRIKGGKMSNYLNDNIKVGDKILALSPLGNFKFEPENIQRHIVLIGGGSGITPLFSIIKSVLIKEPASTVSLIYVNSNKENTIFYQQLEQWQSEYSSRFRIVHYWSDVAKSEQAKAGFWERIFKKKDAYAHRINSVRMKAFLNDLHVKENTNTEFYICGAKGLMEIATATLQEMDFPNNVIHKENFYTETKTENTPSEAQQAHQIKILLRGKEHEVNVSAGKSILFAGLDFGLDMPFSCQSGNCISCAGKCLSGKVEMTATDGLTEEQIKNGYILTCVGFPKSDDVVIEFN